MKKKFTILTAAVVTAAYLTIPVSAARQSNNFNRNSENTVNTDSSIELNESNLSLEGYGSLGALADTDLSVEDMLMYAIQDEYSAHGEYSEIIEFFGSKNPYKNIIKSEETHIKALKTLFNTYDMKFPDDDSAEHLVVPDSLLEAAKTGVEAEIKNIDMYDEFLTYTLPDNIRSVFESLKKASESHLNAFQKQVDRLSWKF